MNTEGYSRQRTELNTTIPNNRGGHYFGSGVGITSVERIFDNFLADQVRTYTSQQAQQESFLTYASQLDDVLGSDGLGLNTAMESFFNAAHEVANDPSSIVARQVMLTEGQLLANNFNVLNQQLGGIGQQINSALSAAIKEVNQLSAGVAELNVAIVAAEGASAGASPNDLLDQRDELINRLSEYLSVSTLDETDGSVSVFVGNGQTLVIGANQFDLHEIIDTSTTPAQTSIGYGPTQVDVSAQLTGGEIGGILQARADLSGGVLTELDTIAQGIADNINIQHQRGIALDGTAGSEFFVVPTLPDVVTAGSLQVAITNPRDIAAGFPIAVSTSSAATGTGEIEVSSIDEITFPITIPYSTAITLTFDAATNQYTATDGVNPAVAIAYDPATDSGTSVSFVAPMSLMSLTLTGEPDDGDIITLTAGSAIGDNRNALAMAEIQTAKLLNGGTQTFSGSYGLMVATIATKTHQADVGQRTQQGLLDQVKLRYESVSGVNLDEEAANLIKYQQSYQAASQIITVSNTVFNSLLNAIR